MHAHSLLLLTLQAATAVTRTVVHGPGGDVVVFSHGAGHTVFASIVAAVSIATGGWAWYTCDELRFPRQGRLGGPAMIVFGLAVLAIAVVARDDRVRVSRESVDILSGGERVLFSLSDVKQIETYQADNGRGQIRPHVKFVLHNGQEHDYADPLVVSSVDHIQQALLARNGGDRRLAGGGRPLDHDARAAEAQRLAARQALHEGPGNAAAEEVKEPHPAADQDAAGNLSPVEPRPAKSPPRPPVPSQQRPPPDAVQVASSTRLAIGTPVDAQWGGTYFKARVVDLVDDGRVRIHYIGWPDSDDETVTRDRLWVLPVDLVRHALIAASAHGKAGATPTARKPSNVVRNWTDDKGTHHAEAQLVDFKNGEVTLKRVDNGKLVTIPLDRLSHADQAFILDWLHSEAEAP